MATMNGKKGPREIRDIRFPTSHVPERSAAGEIPVRKVLPVPVPRRKPLGPQRRLPLGPGAIFAACMLLVVVVGGVSWYRQKAAQASRLQKILAEANLPAAGSDLPESLAGWVAAIKDIFSNYGGIGNFSLQAIRSLERTSALLQRLPAKVLAKDGPGTAADLAALRDSLKSLGDSLRAATGGESASALASLTGYSAYIPDVERARLAVERLLALLESPGEHHVLVLFGNSAELRPGGGFLGSFADLTLGNSAIGGITVHDVNEVDRGLAANIAPPKPLQGIATRWRAADANWFFDYPKSAAKTLEIMGRSSFYASSTLDGAILISPKVLQDVLAATGPLTLEDGTIVTADDVIPMIQREVQAGQASGSKNPKEILSKLMPHLESRLRNLEPAARDKLLASARNWLRDKDVAIFMKDPELARILAYYEADGGVYVLPQVFAGDYFAAVHANLGGGKSDAMIEDLVDIESDLRADGLVENRVTVIRTSRAAGADEWWYRVTNQDYLQALTPSGATLTAASGGTARSFAPRADYSQGFEIDRDVRALESGIKPAPGFPAVSQFRDADKNVFATWLATPAGGTGTARFEYHRKLKDPFRDGDHYTFVFERQSGARQSLHLVLNAPPGFVWKESGVSKYEYLKESTPWRIVLALTLQAI